MSIAAALAQEHLADSIRTQAFTRTHHRIVRELLRKEFFPSSEKNGKLSTRSLVLNPIELSQLVKKMTEATFEDWSPKEIEENLLYLGAPIPAIDFIATYLQKLPAMKIKLLGQSDAVDTADSLAMSLSIAITASMERLLLDSDAIDHAYTDLGQC